MDWIARNLQSSPYETVQDLFWRPVGSWFWYGLSVVAAVGSIALFINLMREVDIRRSGGQPGIDALMVGRMGWMGALIMGAGIPYNSGLQPWALALFVTSGTFMALLIVTGWCELTGSFWYRVGQVFGRLIMAWRHKDKHAIRARPR
jgi:hypothetical protein